MCIDLVVEEEVEMGVFKPSSPEEFLSTFLSRFNHEAALAFEEAILNQDGPVFHLEVACDELDAMLKQASQETRMLVVNRLASENWTVCQKNEWPSFEYRV